MKKIIAILLTLVLLVSFVGCGENKKEENKNYEVVSYMKEVNKRQVVYHNGEPFFFNAVHLRYDHLVRVLDNKADKAMADAMRLIKKNGFETVIIYVNWGKIYDGKEYDLTWFTKQFKEAEKNDLKVLINWFGSNVCGFGGYQSWQKDDPEKYPYLVDAAGNPVLGTGPANGNKIPDFTAPAFLEDESKALTLICDWLYENDKDRRTVALQICDEPNNNEGGYGQWMSQFKSYADYMDKLGAVVKNSKYPMVTYTVLMGAGYNDTLDGYNFKQRIKYLVDLPNLDFVGYSIYQPVTSPKFKELEQEGNMPVMIGLNPASWVTPAQALYCITNAYGYCHYQFVNYDEGDGGYYSMYGNKVDGTVFGERTGTKYLTNGEFTGHLEVDHAEVVNMNKSIFKMDELIATNLEKMMAVFNNKAKNDFDGKKTIDNEKIYMTYKNLDKKYGACGMMLKADDGNFYGFTTLDASFTFTHDITVTEGYYEGGKWISEGEVEVKDKTFTTEGGKVYQVILK